MLTRKSSLCFIAVCALCAAASVRLAAAGSPPQVDGRVLTKDKLDALANELAVTANTYGPDVVALQVALMTRTIAAGAVGSTTVRVAGASSHAGKEFLKIDVETGLIFDADTTSPEDRFRRLWDDIAKPALALMTRFEFEPAGLDLLFSYRTQALSNVSDGQIDPSAPTVGHHTRVVIPASALDRLASGEIMVEELLSISNIGEEVIDDKESDHRNE